MPPRWASPARRPGSLFLGDRNTVHDQLTASSPDAGTALFGAWRSPHHSAGRAKRLPRAEGKALVVCQLPWLRLKETSAHPPCYHSLYHLERFTSVSEIHPLWQPGIKQCTSKGKLCRTRRVFPSRASFPTLKWPHTSPITYSFQDHSGEQKDPRGG